MHLRWSLHLIAYIRLLLMVNGERKWAYPNTLRSRQNGRRFADDTFKRIFLNENVSIKISLKFVPQGPISNIPALVQIMAWRRPGDMPLSEPMMVNLLTHICVIQLQYTSQMDPRRLPVEITVISHSVKRNNYADRSFNRFDLARRISLLI